MSVPSTPVSKEQKRKKKVTFHPSTVLGDSDHIALTITRHSYIHDKGYTQYFIKLMCRGVEWTLHKRYRDFYYLHHELIKENQIYNIDLPKLPEKRWFERQRWINRADEKYGWIRRIQLQDYLRAIVKLRVLRNESLSFWKFICMPKRVMFGPQPGTDDADAESICSVTSDRPPQGAQSPAHVAGRALVPGTAEKRPSVTLNPIDFLFSKPAVLTDAEAVAHSDTVHEAEGTSVEDEEYDPEKDLEKFNESSQLAAQEAILRERYGTKNTKADIDNVHNVRKSTDARSPEAAANSTKLASALGALKLNRVYDDNGEEITTPTPLVERDLSYLASSNAILNTRITSKDEFSTTVPLSSSPSSTLLSSSGAAGMSGAIRAPPIHLVSANQELWSSAELATALEAIDSEVFDTAVHFSGPRSGLPSSTSTPNVSQYQIDMNRNDLSIMPGLLSRLRFASEGTDSDNGATGNGRSASKDLPVPQRTPSVGTTQPPEVPSA